MFEIGNSLREARVRQALDYPQVELATKIRVKYLRAIEEEQFANLPGETYIRGFLRTYAEFLGLDGQIYVDEYSSRFVVDGREETAPRRAARRPRRDRGIERRSVVLALLGIASLAGLVIVAWKYGGGDSASSTPAVIQTTASAPRSAPSARILELRGVGRGTYVEVRRNSAAGTVLLQATVPRGKVERLTGTRFFLFVRRPVGLRVLLGGKAVALPSRRNLKVVVTPSRTSRVSG